MEILDARGLSCPEPVIMLSKAMMSKENKYQMIVDSPTAKENVSNYGKSKAIMSILLNKMENIL